MISTGERVSVRLRAPLLLAAVCLGIFVAGAGTAQATAPANDAYQFAQPISGLTADVQGTTAGATLEPGEDPYGSTGASHSVWYSWTAPATGHLDVTSVNPVVITAFVINDGYRYRTACCSAGAGIAVQRGEVFAIVVAGGNGGVSSAFTMKLKLIPVTHVLTIKKTGSGTVTSQPAGINCGITCSGTYIDGVDISLVATPGAGSTFEGWSGAGCGRALICHISPQTNVTLTPTFKGPPADSSNFVLEAYRGIGNGSGELSVSVPGPGKVTLSGKGIKGASLRVVKAKSVKMTVVPKGELKKKLNKTGKASTRVTITFDPGVGSVARLRLKASFSLNPVSHPSRQG